MSRLAIQILFVILGLAWGVFVSVDIFVRSFGGCLDPLDQICERYREEAASMVRWRGLCVLLLLVIAYRLVRKEPNA